MNQHTIVNEPVKRPRNDGHQALTGLKVLEIGNNPAAAYCCKLLAELGAEVIKVEAPRQGLRDRNDRNISGDNKKGCLFAYLNSSKKGITLNIERKSGQKVLCELIRNTDILVEGNVPQRAKEFGLDYEILSREIKGWS